MKLARVLLKSGMSAVLVSAMGLPQAMASGNACKAIFQGEQNTQNHIDTAIKDLASLRVKLDEAKASAQSSVAITALESDYLRKEREIFEALVKGNIMSREELKERIRREIKNVATRKNAEEERRKEEQRRQAEDAHPLNFAKKMIFHEVRPGKFKMGEAQVETEITQPFAMMSTQVTQMMWAQLKAAMGEKDPNKINPSKFKSGTDSSIRVPIEGIAVDMQPDHPVEQVNYKDVQEFVGGLNKLSNSSDTKTQKLLEKLIPGHQKGDHYDLPTEAQWEFVMRSRGNANKDHFDRDDEADLHNYAWFDGNSGGQTHAVATLQPRMIDGKPFYDLEGNVEEWNKDYYGGVLEGGIDPQGPAAGSFRVLRGGGWYVSAMLLRFGCPYSAMPDKGTSYIGFRLVRTRDGSL